MRLGTHPELVERIWDVLPQKLPENCRCVVYQTPVLANFHTGVIFAFAGGTHTYAFRLPPQKLVEAIQSGGKRVQRYPAYPSLGIKASVFSLEELGNEWVFGGWIKGEEEWCLAAYTFAGEAGK